MDSQAKCDELGVFLAGLPQDVIVLLAVQDSAFSSGRTLPISELTEVGAQDAANVAANTSHAVIGYKGQQAMAWKDELRKNSGQGPAEVSSSIPINCSYVPEGDTAKSVLLRFYLYVMSPPLSGPQLGSFSKQRRRRRREPQQTKGLMSKTMVLHVRFESWYISLPSSAKQQREMTKFYVFWRTWTTMAYFWYLLLELNAVRACFSWAYL